MGLGMAVAGCIAPDDAGPSGEAAPPVLEAAKPIPVRPAPAPGVSTDGTLPAKPAGVERAVTPADAWSVTVSASPNTLWPTQLSTITGTANMDVGPTPYFIKLWSQPIGGGVTNIATCGSGTTCSIAVTEPTPMTVMYSATVETATGTVIANGPPGSTLRDFVDVFWLDADLQLFTGAQLTIGGTNTVLATTAQDITRSPFFIELFDDTTGAFLAECGSGSSCFANVTETTATTHAFRACVAGLSTTFPPPNLQECVVHYTTWTNSSVSVSLSAPSQTPFRDTPVTVTATSSIDVGATPYYIQIFDQTGARIATCGSGTTCSATYLPPSPGGDVVAFVSLPSATAPPPSIQAQSPTMHVTLGPPRPPR